MDIEAGVAEADEAVREDDDLVPAGRGQLHGRRLHAPPLQVEGLALQAHLPGARPLHVRLHHPLAHLQAVAHPEPEEESTTH